MGTEDWAAAQKGTALASAVDPPVAVAVWGENEAGAEALVEEEGVWV